MSLKKVINKGYTLEITSWENDGDSYNTKFVTVKTKEEAAQIYKICTELFKSCNNGEGGVGNSMDGEYTQDVVDYYDENKEVLTFEPFIELKEIFDAGEYDSDDLIFDYFRDFAHNLMGGSEYFDFRVCESVVVTHSPEDIYLEEINF